MAAIRKRSTKKRVRAVVRRFARLVIEGHYAREGVSRPREEINAMVKAVERSTVPRLVRAVKGHPTHDDIAELSERSQEEAAGLASAKTAARATPTAPG